MDSSKLPKTRAEAQAAGATHYFTGVPCQKGHIAPRKTKGACVECLREEWAAAAEKRVAYFRAYNQREEVREKKHEWYTANREKVIQAAATRPAHVKKEYQDAWKKRNTAWVRADTKARRRKHRVATPRWLSRAQRRAIRELYKIAIITTQSTGEQYVVDHIYPLRADVVCGLHVPWNLRVITQEENLKKSNGLPDDTHALAFPPK